MEVTKINPFEKVKYFVKGMWGNRPTQYNWYCDSTKGKETGNYFSKSSGSETDEQTCGNYSEAGKFYEPRVEYEYKDSEGGNKSGSCENAVGVGVTVGEKPVNFSSCSVVVSGDGGSTYAKTVSIGQGDSVKARVVTVPQGYDLSGLVNWEFNGIRQPETNSAITKTINDTGTVKVKAKVGSIECDTASVEVKEALKIR